MSNALRIAHGPFGRVALLDMDAPLVRHAHPHCHVLIKAEGADTQFLVRDKVAPLTRENAVLINAWEPHSYEHDPQKLRTIILALYIEPVWLGGFRRNWIASNAPGFFDRPGVLLPPQMHRLADELAEAMVAGAEAAQERSLSNLMIAVIERFAAWQAAPSLRDMPRGADPRARKAKMLIQDDPGAVTDMAALAQQAGLSRANLFRLFEQSAGVPPRMFQNVLRLERAVAALVGGDAPLASISADLGFSAPPHFTRFFRNHAGVTPSEFRAVSRQDLQPGALQPGRNNETRG